MPALGTPARDFRLPDTEGKIVSLDDFKGSPALLVVFMCNHCPFVKHILDGFAALAAEYAEKGAAIVAINPNDVSEFPEDSPEMMAKIAREKNFAFGYLYDESQQVAKAYRASCTPDFFLFDAERKLAYRGQMDDSRPGNDLPVTGTDLRAALDAVLEGKPAPAKQIPSIGCNIKWKAGSEPEYFGK
jgi:peroxiredoxin